MSNPTHEGSRKLSRVEQYIGIGILVLLVIGSFLVLRPFLSALTWALVLCFSLWPVQRRLRAWLGGRNTLAALIMTSIIALVLVVPTVVITLNLAGDVRDIGVAARKWAADGPPDPPAWVNRIPAIGVQLSDYWQELADDARRLLTRTEQSTDEPPQELIAATQPIAKSKLVQAAAIALAWMRTWLPLAGLAIVAGVTNVALSVFLTFFIFRDGDWMADSLKIGLGRITGERGIRLLNLAGGTVRGVVYGILGTALVQGILAGIGFLIAGVPGAALLGLVTFLLSPVPIGPPLVWLPASLWLFSQGWTGWGIFMLVWGLIISSVDNVVKPWIISHGSAMPFILIFFGVLGGALAFGFIGVFLGPTLLAIVYRLVQDWSKELPRLTSNM
jgi:predicted PurR-regulated permease PerM